MNFNDLIKDLAGYPADKIVFVGLGNQLRRDDAAGLILTKEIKSSQVFKNSIFILAQTNPENYLNQILQHQPNLVVFIDAAYWGNKPGSITWIGNSQIDELDISTHSFSISMIEKYLKLNAELDIKYLVIQPESLAYGISLSRLLKRKIKQFIN